ncbi:heavy metal transporter [soil metagenome]
MRTESGLVGRILLVLVLVLVVVGGVGLVMKQDIGLVPDREGCKAEVGGVAVPLTTEQAENAAIIAAVGVRRGLPARAVSIALATAYQESKIVNVGYGDRDSLGLFQQRPSQGWGTAEQIQDPYQATNRFYDELEKVDGFETMRITEAAQLVQRSGFPEAYEDHAEDGRVLASALTGYSPESLTCVARPDEGESQQEGPSGLTSRAEAVRADLERAFGDQPVGGFAPGGVRDGHVAGSAHYDGRALDVFFRPVNERNRRLGWALAHYLVAHADRLQIQTVIFDDRIWTAGRRSELGWRDYDASARPGDRAVLEHRDHVHVDVTRGE